MSADKAYPAEVVIPKKKPITPPAAAIIATVGTNPNRAVVIAPIKKANPMVRRGPMPSRIRPAV